MDRRVWIAAGALALGACACAPISRQVLTPAQSQFARSGLSAQGFAAMAARMDPAALALAGRHDPSGRRADPWNRTVGWTSLDISKVPNLGLGNLEGQSAEELNALRPVSDLPIRPMKPFVLPGGGDDRHRALKCLSQAVYYEAAREPQVGQRAVAQVVLNRMRHPAYPKSVCGVVYQGSARATGCQFTFTCDGALKWTPEPVLWRRAQAVAEAALNGYVDRQVGSATHYHAAYVAPYWAPTLVKMRQVGSHIFYRWTGPWGEPAAFTGRYAGREALLSPVVLAGGDPRTEGGLLSPEAQGLAADRKVVLAVAGEVRTYSVADAASTDGAKTRVRGTLYAPRRQPTPDEVKAINDSLAQMEQDLNGASGPSPAP